MNSTTSVDASPKGGRPTIVPEHAALLMIDFQRDFCAKGGYADVTFGSDGGGGGDDDDDDSNSLAWVNSIIPQAKRLLDGARECTNWRLIVHTREGYAPDLSNVGEAKLRRSQAAGAPIGTKGPLGRFLICGEYGQDTIECLQAKGGGEVVLDKSTYGTFASTRLQEILQEAGVRQIVLAGVTADVCVHSTMREAVDRGYECFYCKDAISTPDESLRQACERMVEHEGGIWGWLVTVDDVLRQVQGSVKS